MMELIRLYREGNPDKLNKFRKKFKHNFPYPHEIDKIYSFSSWKSAEKTVNYLKHKCNVENELKIIRCFNTFWICEYEGSFKRTYDDLYKLNKE